MSIPLSPSCREQMLTSKAWSAVIFERARQEVMEKLGGAKVFYCVSLHHRFCPEIVCSVCFSLVPTTPIIATNLFLNPVLSLTARIDRGRHQPFYSTHQRILPVTANQNRPGPEPFHGVLRITIVVNRTRTQPILGVLFPSGSKHLRRVQQR